MVIEDMYLRPPKFKVQTFKLECQCGLDSAQRILTKNILLRSLNTMCRTHLFTHSQTLITIDKEMTKAEDMSSKMSSAVRQIWLCLFASFTTFHPQLTISKQRNGNEMRDPCARLTSVSR